MIRLSSPFRPSHTEVRKRKKEREREKKTDRLAKQLLLFPPLPLSLIGTFSSFPPFEDRKLSLFLLFLFLSSTAKSCCSLHSGGREAGRKERPRRVKSRDNFVFVPPSSPLHSKRLCWTQLLSRGKGAGRRRRRSRERSGLQGRP